MAADSQRFARVVLGAFEAVGRTTDTLVSRAGGPSTSTMTKLRNAAKGVDDLAEPRSNTLAAIEAVTGWPAGTAKRVWNGAEPPDPATAEVVAADPEPLPEGARRIGAPEDDLVEFTVEGNFGVRAVVKGPIRDLDQLQAAVSKLISGMQTDNSESTNEAVP